jgi:hypothetical protein
MITEQKVIRAQVGLLELTNQLGKTPIRTFLDAMPMTKEKMIAA